MSTVLYKLFSLQKLAGWSIFPFLPLIQTNKSQMYFWMIEGHIRLNSKNILLVVGLDACSNYGIWGWDPESTNFPELGWTAVRDCPSLMFTQIPLVFSMARRRGIILNSSLDTWLNAALSNIKGTRRRKTREHCPVTLILSFPVELQKSDVFKNLPRPDPMMPVQQIGLCTTSSHKIRPIISILASYDFYNINIYI